jgi:hypothetical protein
MRVYDGTPHHPPCDDILCLLQLLLTEPAVGRKAVALCLGTSSRSTCSNARQGTPPLSTGAANMSCWLSTVRLKLLLLLLLVSALGTRPGYLLP